MNGQPAGVSAATGFGIAGLVLSILALLICWVPLLGIFCIPLAVLGGIAGAIGFIVALPSGRGYGLPLASIGLCILAVVVFVIVTGVIATGVGTAVEEAGRDARAQDAREVNERTAYSNQHVRVEDINLTRRAGTDTDRLRFSVVNEGDRSLSMVEVTFYFVDAAGEAVHAEILQPIDTSSFSGDSRPLAGRGGRWTMRDGEAYRVGAIGLDLTGLDVTYTVTDIRFNDQR